MSQKSYGKPTIDPDGALPDAVRGEVAETIWTGGEVHDTFTVGEPPHAWVIAGCEVPEAVYRRHAELLALVQECQDVHQVCRHCGHAVRPAETPTGWTHGSGRARWLGVRCPGRTSGAEPRTGARACRECGCTDRYACPGGCSWAAADLCSACAPSLPKKI